MHMYDVMTYIIIVLMHVMSICKCLFVFSLTKSEGQKSASSFDWNNMGDGSETAVTWEALQKMLSIEGEPMPVAEWTSCLTALMGDANGDSLAGSTLTAASFADKLLGFETQESQAQ